MIDRLLLYLRTLVHLQPGQVYYRLARRLQSLLPPHVERPDAVPRLAVLAVVEGLVSARGPGSLEERLSRARSLRNGRVSFLNEERLLEEVSWEGVQVNRLWTYNLHYFDYALDLAWAYRETGDGAFADVFQQLALDWTVCWTRARGPGWDPYPTSLRIVNWVYAIALFGSAISQEARRVLWRSIAGQARLLYRRPELDVLGNHYHKNLKALFIAALVVDDPGGALLEPVEEEHWQQLFDQVNEDGGHVERSPMYHAIALADFLEVRALAAGAGRSVPAAVDERLARMLEAMAFLSRPDGGLHLLNDSADRVAPFRNEFENLAALALQAELPIAAGTSPLTRTGFFGIVEPDGTRLMIDGGAPAPRHQPGHSHNGILSFELDLRGRRVVVDSGVCGYDGDPLRKYVRSTRAHSTLVIDGGDQSEMWGTFRVARRARILAGEQRRSGNTYEYTGAYTPFHSRRIVHSRHITWDGTSLQVRDRVSSARPVATASFLHFHPGLRLERAGNAVRVLGEGVSVRLVPRGNLDMTIASGWFCPEFGRAVEAPVVRMDAESNNEREIGFLLIDEGGVGR